MPTFFHQRAKNEKTKKWMGAQNILNGNSHAVPIPHERLNIREKSNSKHVPKKIQTKLQTIL